MATSDSLVARSVHLSSIAILGGLLSPALAQSALSTSGSGPSAVVPATPLVWADFDGDGLPDAADIRANGRVRVLHNLGDGSLDEVTPLAGGLVSATFVLWSDRDRDGLAELLVGTRHGPLLLFEYSDGAFENVASIAGIDHEATDYSASWIDYDQDGLADLQVFASSGTHLYRSVGEVFERIDLGGPNGGTAGVNLHGLAVGDVADRGAAEAPAGLRASPPGSPTDRGVSPGTGGGSGAASGPPGVTSSPGGTANPAPPPLVTCASAVDDQAGGSCIPASSSPALGSLYPISLDLFVDSATSHVGLGTTSPAAALHVDQDGSVLAEGTVFRGSGVPVEGPGTRMMWYPAKAALRAGYVEGTEWDEANIAAATVAFGQNTIASMFGASALGGTNNSANGPFSTVSGGASNEASGDSAAVSGGAFNVASGLGASVLAGRSNVAAGDMSLAGGFLASANHAGSAVLADSTSTVKSSSAVDQLSLFYEGGMRVLAEGTATPSLVVTEAGDVGVGTAGPSARFDVVGPDAVMPDLDAPIAAEVVAGDGDPVFGAGGTALAVRGGVGWDGGLGLLVSGGFGFDDGGGGAEIYGASANSEAPPAVLAVAGDGDGDGGHGVVALAGDANLGFAGDGVRGTGGDPGGTGVHGFAGPGGGFGVFSDGDFGSTGTKSFIQPHPDDASKEIRFVCLEGNESGTYFRGTGRIENGRARIEVPEEFRLVSEEDGLTVQLTSVGGLALLAVESQDLDEIHVLGDRDVEFHYFVNGVRRGFADLDPMQPNRTFRPRERGVPYGAYLRPAVREMLVQNGVLNADFTPNEVGAAQRGWRLTDPRPDRRPAPSRRLLAPPSEQASDGGTAP